jgi:enoyl-CoA hydratase/carnithine racemase
MSELTSVDYSRYRYLQVGATGRILVITMNRPDRLNAVNAEFHEELRDIWIDVGNDYEVDVVVLTGAGRAFCAGGDVKDMREMAEPFGGGRSMDALIVMQAEARRLARNMLDVEQPIIAAVNGDAFGLGASLALLCDIVVIADDATIADTHVNVGLVAGDGGAVLWPLAVGPHRAKEFLLRGSRITGAEAAAMGLANHSVSRAEVLACAIGIAEDIANRAPMAVRWTKHSINKWLKQVLEQVFDVSIAYELVTMRSADHKEAVAAAVDRRSPKFTGR